MFFNAFIFIMLIANAQIPISGLSQSISEPALVNEFTRGIKALQKMLSYATLSNQGYTYGDYPKRERVDLSNIQFKITSTTENSCDPSKFSLTVSGTNTLFEGSCSAVGFEGVIEMDWELKINNFLTGFGKMKAHLNSHEYLYTSTFMAPSNNYESNLTVLFDVPYGFEISGIAHGSLIETKLEEIIKNELYSQLTYQFGRYDDVIPPYLINYNMYHKVSLFSIWMPVDTLSFLNIHPKPTIQQSVKGQQLLYVQFDTTFQDETKNLYLPLPQTTIANVFGADFSLYISSESIVSMLNFIASQTTALNIVFKTQLLTELLQVKPDINFLMRNIKSLPTKYSGSDNITVSCNPQKVFAVNVPQQVAVALNSACVVNEVAHGDALFGFNMTLNSTISMDYSATGGYVSVNVSNIQLASMTSTLADGLSNFKLGLLLKQVFTNLNDLPVGTIYITPPTKEAQLIGTGVLNDVIVIQYNFPKA